MPSDPDGVCTSVISPDKMALSDGTCAESGAVGARKGQTSLPVVATTNPAKAVSVNALAIALADALDALPVEERPGIVAHVKALAAMTPAKRAAMLTLTSE